MTLRMYWWRRIKGVDDPGFREDLCEFGDSARGVRGDWIWGLELVRERHGLVGLVVMVWVEGCGGLCSGCLGWLWWLWRNARRCGEFFFLLSSGLERLIGRYLWCAGVSSYF